MLIGHLTTYADRIEDMIKQYDVASPFSKHVGDYRDGQANHRGSFAE